ncbi:hypothetical protein P691DRAFT_700642 [Macrolepiota fuliginosa MF-IS2]|uniref:Uncharacterized protein n=1 Tax=Macrolepiota fuliginosa MF-IS2 TaxID=1400762 RepID=A0A9P5XG13_9AGAR|nr:hypothetical protein P691DRAFT_700642 [Macrolepiota fuliginosa MF-IS2]
MSMGEADAKFPGQHTGIPPSPTRENPGQVYPKSDPNPAPRRHRSGDDSLAPSAISNPFLLKSALEAVDGKLAEVIAILEGEERTQGRSDKEDALLSKFIGWRDELGGMLSGRHIVCPTHTGRTIRGGMFVD